MTYYNLKFSKAQRKRKGVYLKCETCKREFYVNPARLRQVQKNGNTIRYCSMACYVKTGDNNPFWGKRHKAETITKMMSHPNHRSFDGGITNPNFVRFGDDFVGVSNGWWRENKAKFSKVCEMCGYGFTPILNVHHKDRNRKNNTRNNLQILCPNCHYKEHYEAGDGPFINVKH